ncbi:MAG: hypothetical protein ABI883_03915 [Chthoniobacterales bacterium]
MSALEVIEQIKTLPPAELQQVREFILSEGGESPRIRYIPKEKFKAATAEVFQEHADLMRKLAE